MSLAKILAEIHDEVERAINLVWEGKLHRCVSSEKTSDVERATTLTEEVNEVQDEMSSMIASFLGLSDIAGKAVRSVNDLESVLFRWSLDPVKRIDEGDWNFIRHKRTKLREELIQVAAVAAAWVNTLDQRIEADNAARGKQN